MNTHEGYSKKKLSNDNVLLAGGGEKSLADFLGSIRISSSKIQYKAADSAAAWTDLVTLITTDENVKQTPKTDNVNRPLMMINGGTSTGELTSTSMFSTGIYANASTKMITTSGFIKTGSDDTYVLLAGGGHKALSDFSMSHSHPYISSSGFSSNGSTSLSTWGTLTSANGYTGMLNINESGGGSWEIAAKSGQISMLIDGYYYQNEGRYRTTDVTETVTALGTSGNYLTWTKNGTTNNITVPYATLAGTVTVNNSDSNSTYRMVWHSGNTLYSTGGIYCNPSTDCIYASHYYETSDRAKKTNIEYFSEHIRKFTLKASGKTAYGVIAQEVAEMFREGEDGNMTVNYSSVLSYYIGALENRIKVLEDEINKLKNK